MPGLQLPTIPIADLHRHNNEKSCYVTLGAKVYDVTTFVDDHPGGSDLILEHGGKDVSEIMKDEIQHDHSEVAYEILEERLIGFIATEPVLKGAVEGNNPTDILPLMPNKAGLETLKAVNGTANLNGHDLSSRTGVSTAEDLSKPTDSNADYQAHKFLNLDKPLLMQVWNGGFSKDFYLEQVHRPRHYSKGPSAPLFGNFLEPLSKTAWYVVPTVWLPPVAYGSFISYLHLSSFLETAAYWLLGLALWTLVEYGLHRGLFHVDKFVTRPLQTSSCHMY